MVEVTLQEVLKMCNIDFPPGTKVRIRCPFCQTSKINKDWHVMDQGIDAAVEGTFTALVNSPSHLDNMIAPEYTKIGIASIEINGKMYVAYMFSN